MNQFELTIDRIVPEGKGVGIYENLPVYVLGAYPGEKVLVEVFKKKKDFLEAKLIKVLESNSNRIEPKENHYMSCSPWQSINYEYQIELKKEIIYKCFKSLAATDVEITEFYKSPKTYNYRTKLEFSFGEDENKKVFLAFHERGSHRSFIRLEEGCALGQHEMNQTALQILDLINNSGLEEFDLKSLVVRQSISDGKLICALLLKNERERVQNFLKYLQSDEAKKLLPENIIIALSDFRSPLPKVDKVLFQQGEDFIIEEIGNIKLKYYLDSFFQNNIDLFNISLDLMKQFLNENSKVLELYSGVGSIGLNLADKAKEFIGVEIIESAVIAAKENAKFNGVENYESILLPAEKIDSSLLDDKDVLIVDPPRTGLHQKVINMILEKKPKQIIYLSCNPITQASDYNKLKEIYKINHLSGFDFYPNTPHMESLIILNLR